MSNENWRDSETQVIAPKRWTRLNGTDIEVFAPQASGTVLLRAR